jgi:hypothetical protein
MEDARSAEGHGRRLCGAAKRQGGGPGRCSRSSAPRRSITHSLSYSVSPGRCSRGRTPIELDSLRYETEFGEQLRSEVALFERAPDRCEPVLVAMARLNLDERLIRISEAQAHLVRVLGAFADIGLSRETQEAVRMVAAEERERELEPG